MISMLHASPYALPSSKLDFLQEMHIRRGKTDAKAQEMTKKEGSMIRDGARKHQTTMITIEEASKFMDTDSWKEALAMCSHVTRRLQHLLGRRGLEHTCVFQHACE
jgi:hypothetical protein